MYSENSNVILNRMIKNVPSDVDTSEGSLIYDAISPVSQEIANQEINLDQVLNMVFAQSAATNGYSAQLDLRCGEFGVIRKAGTLATGQATFTGSETTPIPIGSIVQTTGGLQYQTTTAGVITGGVATVNVQAIDIGSNYNVPSSTIIQIPIAISGITGVTNTNPSTGGNDDETDLALLTRLLLQVQTPSTSGNSAHYVQWALQVAGIGAAQVFPLWNGAGTVKVCAVDSNMQPLTTPLLTALSAYVESQRPIGATVTYESASALPININVTVVRNTAYTQAQIIASLTASIISYLKSMYIKQNYVSYAVIGSLILATPGVTDYNTFTVNGGTVNVVIGNEQVATMGTVNVIAP
ncbi:baseplate J/gp47 family protein [Clostridium tagluense]|uniref:baseplate J/gp47 family protein n=1 Tax=Clostridium tagluense TaxID=360422 RepID=UPI001C6E92E1|nr:baseplate J/gp47 family protein [Clostridium tagluense]MBW9158865.1 baseplate J/gp47 family protein [Clostridium tagluense]WLC67157.1 baseplate J/gp47 family protein [Clostridium tagluense]